MTDQPFATTIQKTNEWLSEITNRLDETDRTHAWMALRAVLHTLRDRLTVAEAVAFGAQLPLLIRGAYYEGWQPNHVPVRIRHRAEFLERVSEGLRSPKSAEEVEALTRAVLDTMADRVSLGEVVHLANILPREIGALVASNEIR